MFKTSSQTLFFGVLVLFVFCAFAHDKWIVVTTIQYPTQALKILAAIDGWRLVVVADKKTPLDWYLDNCVFLSVHDQQELPYKIIKHLPWNHYSRKNIGYLYAIEHGATVIYETDDDNFLLDNTIDYLPEKTTILTYNTDAFAVNPYEHFGQARVWPRGYPLSTITKLPCYTLNVQKVCIPIQQGLVNNDPDVDAIFRLTQGQETIFDATQPPVSLPCGTMCPFNSQNTLFYKNAFWGLLLPITTSFRVCDIWRSYWVQRLLWDLNAALCFLPPTAIQYRNEHNLLKDFADEIDLYLKTEKLIEALKEWHSTDALLSGRMQMLMQKLIELQFFKQEEMLLVHAWLEDLQNLGYQMPEINT